VFGETVTVTLPLPLPDIGDTSTHGRLSITDHEQPAAVVTVTESESPAAG